MPYKRLRTVFLSTLLPLLFNSLGMLACFARVNFCYLFNDFLQTNYPRTGPIFAIFSLLGRYLIVDDRSDLFSDLLMDVAIATVFFFSFFIRGGG